MGDDQGEDPGVDAIPAPPPRRRALDRTWQVEQELDFAQFHSESPKAPQEAVFGFEDPTVSAMLAVPEAAMAEAPAARPSESTPLATLRRLKQLEADVVCSIENECGMNVQRGVELFRLVLLNSESPLALRRSTRVLLIAQEAFLCEDPRAVEAEAFREAPSTTEAKMRSQSWINLDLRFFRATPKGCPRIGKAPVLHLTLSGPEDGHVQAMEFIGKHQRQYYAQEGDAASDALAQHLTESLLRVALEFVFHPSRSKFARELLVVRECSVEPEALLRREELLPRMLQSLQKSNDKVKKVILEFGGQLYLPSDQKAKSFVVLDEDVLKVVPAKEQVKAEKNNSERSANFKGFNKGFLNNKVLKGPAQAIPEPVPPDAPPVTTSSLEKRQLLMPAAAEAPGAAMHRALVSTLAAEPPAEPEEEPEELGEVLNISQLASQLFGDAEAEEEEASVASVPKGAVPPETAPPDAESERDDLVALWMKQRW